MSWGGIRAWIAIGVLAWAGLLAADAAGAAPYADLIIDANSGQVLHESNADAPRIPASLTKMMTLYIVFDMIEKRRLTLDTPLTISETAAAAQPSKLGLKPGATIIVKDAIKALVTASANDVARAVAENLGGSEAKFARYMTWQAKKLGMKGTRFANASGLPDDRQVTTARDYVTLSLRLLDDFPQYFGVFKTPVFAYGKARYKNHNGLLFSFQGTDGIKTGYTRASGFNLAVSVRRDGKHVVGVIFGGASARERNTRMRALLRQALAVASTERTRPTTSAAQTEVATAPAKPRKPKAQSQGEGPAIAEATTGADQPQPAAKPKAASKAKPAVQATGAGTPATSAAKPAKKAKGTATTTWSADVAATPPEATAAAPQPVAASTAAAGYHIQIGAFGSPEEARQHLVDVQAKAGALLGGHKAMTLQHTASQKTWYRARFAGFDRAQATTTCDILKAQSIDCVVMQAN